MLEQSCTKTCNTAPHRVLMNTGMVYTCDIRLGIADVEPKYRNFVLAKGMEMYKNFKNEDLVQPEVENGAPDTECEI